MSEPEGEVLYEWTDRFNCKRIIVRGPNGNPTVNPDGRNNWIPLEGLEEIVGLAATVKALREERAAVQKIIAEAHVASTLPMALKILGPALDLLASPSVPAVNAEEE